MTRPFYQGMHVSSKINPHIKDIFVVWLFSLVLTAILTAPLIVQLDTRMASGKYQWSHAWAMEMLHQGQVGEEGFDVERSSLSWNPADVVHGAGSFEVYTRMLDHPRGGRLVLLSWPNLLLGHFLRMLGCKPLVAFNLSFLFTLSLAPFCTFYLARACRISRRNSFFAASLFMTSAYFFGILHNGQLAKSNLWCLSALALVCLQAGRGKKGHFVLLTLLLPICLSTSPYYFLFATVPCALLFLVGTVEHRPQWKNLLFLPLVGLSTIYTCLPLVNHYQDRVHSLLAPATGAQISDDFGIVATPLSWLFPIPLLQANGVFIQGEKHYAALGIVALFLSGVGWYKNRSALTFLWMTLLVVFALLALGTGKQQQLGIPLPFDAATLLLPEDTDIIHRYRAIVISTLAVSILGGLGADSLPKRFCWGIWVICLAERLLPLPVPIQTEVVHLPRVYVDLSQEEEYYGIIEFPCDILSPKDLHPEYFALLNQLNQRQLFYQIYHNKGIGMVDKANLSREVYRTPLLRALVSITFEAATPSPENFPTDSIDWIVQNNFRYLLVHDRYIKPEYRPVLHSYLRSVVGEGVMHQQDQVWSYALPQGNP